MQAFNMQALKISTLYTNSDSNNNNDDNNNDDDDVMMMTCMTMMTL